MTGPTTRYVRFLGLLIIAGLLSAGCAGKQQDLAQSDDTAVFLPIVTDYNVDLFVDQVDGKATRFGAFDQVTVDAGSRELAVRLEYAPAAGTAPLVGSLGNLLLRAGTNKTFRTTMTVDVAAGHNYELIARADGSAFDIIVFDKTEESVVEKKTFELKDGQFERAF